MLKKIPILRQIYAFFRSQEIPMPFKAVSLFIYLAYVIHPFDLIPDVLNIFFGVGYLDDVVFAGVFFGGMRKLWEYLQERRNQH